MAGREPEVEMEQAERDAEMVLEENSTRCEVAVQWRDLRSSFQTPEEERCQELSSKDELMSILDITSLSIIRFL